MKINFKGEPLYNLKGIQMQRVDVNEDGKQEKVPLTLADIVIANLTKEDAAITPTERFSRYLLSRKIEEATGGVDLKIEELNAIKTVMGQCPTPLFQGRVWEFIESQEPVE